MSGLKRITKAIRDANKAADRCTCGHKKSVHFWGPFKNPTCRIANCLCQVYSVSLEKAGTQ